MTIDEAIARERQLAKEQRSHIGTWDKEYSKKCEECAEEHEQLAEWLEELKVYQQHEIICHKGYNAGYNKAIDDFVKAIVDRGLSANDDKYCITHYDNYLKVIKELAERLKAGGKE